MHPSVTDGLSAVSPTLTIEVVDADGNVIPVKDSEPITITLCPSDETVKDNSKLIPAYVNFLFILSMMKKLKCLKLMDV